VKPAQLAQLIVVAIAALAVYSFARTVRDAEMRRVCTPLCALAPEYAARNRLAPDFELPSLSGGRVRLSSFRGKVVVMNFWTKSCRPCLEEMPSLAELGKVIRERNDMVLVTVNTDETADDVRGTLKSVLNTDNPPFLVLLDPEASVVRDRYGTRLYPETWFIDTKGVIRARVDAARNWDDALALDFAKVLHDPLSCEINFTRGRPGGELAGLCADVAPNLGMQ
jgi:thiol-disulfide isomerase/thioredoxin